MCRGDLRWGSPENPMQSAYLVVQGYANICKMVYRDASNCYAYQFLEICIRLCNDPIGLIQKGHLKLERPQMDRHMDRQMLPNVLSPVLHGR